MKSSMEAFEAKIKDLLAVAPTPEDYENLVEFKELIELGWRLCDQYHEGKTKVLIESLDSIAYYDEPNADKEEYWQELKPNKLPSTMATDTQIAREALQKYRGGV